MFSQIRNTHLMKYELLLVVQCETELVLELVVLEFYYFRLEIEVRNIVRCVDVFEM